MGILGLFILYIVINQIIDLKIDKYTIFEPEFYTDTNIINSINLKFENFDAEYKLIMNLFGIFMLLFKYDKLRKLRQRLYIKSRLGHITIFKDVDSHFSEDIKNEINYLKSL